MAYRIAVDAEGELVFNTGIQSTRKHREYTVKKSIVSIVLLSGAVLLASATPAMAAHVGIGINIGVPGYYPAPVYVQPAPVYMPPPVYVQPAPVYVRPAPVYYAPAPVYYGPGPYYRDYHRHGRPYHGHGYYRR